MSSELGDALLVLFVSMTTLLSPPSAHLEKLSALISDLADPASADIPPIELPVSFVSSVKNDDEDVAIWCVRGHADVVLSTGGIERVIAVDADQALVVPRGHAHRIIGAAGSVVSIRSSEGH